jgi:hypothetical protein
MYKKGARLSRTEIPPMITDSNQACMAKMIGRRVQEVSFNRNKKRQGQLDFALLFDN